MAVQIKHKLCPISTPFSHTLTAREAQHGGTGLNMMETISMIKQNIMYSCALHMHVYADFMHLYFLWNYTQFVLVWISILEICTASQWMTTQGPSRFRMIFRTRVHDILVIGICDGTYNMLIYRRTSQVWPTNSIGLPRLAHWHFIWIRSSTVRGTAG